MNFSKMCVKAVPVVCALAITLSGTVLANDAKSDSSKSVVAAKQLKPQTTCPVMGEPINKKLFVDANGKRIYVCCKGCLKEVKANHDTYIKKLEEQGQSVETVPGAVPAVSKKAVSVADSTSKTKVLEAGYYTCSMHPEVHQDKPGSCPKCGMTLEFKKTEASTKK